MSKSEIVWLSIGFLGQALFSARFIIQWLASEKKRRSVIPIAFWYLSLLGGIILFIYAIYKRDPVFIIGQSSGIVIYSRNLYLIFANRAGKHSNQKPALNDYN